MFARVARVPTALLVFAVLSLTTAVLLSCVAVLGGFERRNSLTERQPEQVLALGPVDVQFIEAAQYVGEEVVQVQASCRLTLDSSWANLKIDLSDAVAGYYQPPGQEIVFADDNLLSFGATSQGYDTDRKVLAPDVPAVPCVFYFQLPEGSPPADVFRVIAFEMAFIEDQNVKNDADTSKTWQPEVDGYWIELPVSHPTRVY